MKILFLLAVLWGSFVQAQSPINTIFTKYSDKHGVQISTDAVSVPTDSSVKTPLSSTIRVMTIDNEDEEKKITQLIKKILRDCNRILNQKEFTVVSIEKDDESSNKVYKYQSGNVIEICELEQDEDRLTLTVTQFIGISAGVKTDIRINAGKG